MEDATIIAAPDNKRGRPRKSPMSATTIAGRIFDETKGQPRIVYVKTWGAFCVLKDGHYRPMVDKLELERFVWTFIMDHCRPTVPTSALVQEVVKQMRYGIPRTFDKPHEDLLAFDDCILTVGPNTTNPHDPEQVCVRRQPFSLADVQAAECPTFKKFLSTVLVKPEDDGPDENLIMMMQELFGYCLMTNISAAAAFFFVGEGANGKSKMSEVLRAMVGAEYVAAMSLEELTMNSFRTSNLVGKFLNLSNEEESKYMKSDKFKALVTGDSMTAERKFGDPFEFSPQVKLVFSTNEMPTFDGVNHGIRRRIKIIPFHHIVTKAERDPYIVDKILPEMPGIVSWALIGAQRLYEHGFEFTVSESSELAKEEFEEESSTVVGFFKETYDINVAGFQPAQDMYEAYKSWCVANGKKPMAKLRVFKDMNRMFPELKAKRQYVSGRQVRGYEIGFRGGTTQSSSEPTF